MVNQVVFMSDTDDSFREHLRAMAEAHRIMGHASGATAIDWALSEVDRVQALYQEYDESVMRERGHMRRAIDDLTAANAELRRQLSVAQ